MSKPEPRDGLYLNHVAANYNFIEADKWSGWADAWTKAEKDRWKDSQGCKPNHMGSRWHTKAELKVPVEYLT